MFRFFSILILLCFVFPAACWAKVVDETEIDQKVREIAKTLRCTVCQTENIWESGAPLAHQMRDAIRERVVQGQSTEEIRAYFHSRYGDYIMMEPPKQGINWLIWLAPFLLLFGGGVLLWREVKRWVTRTPPSQPPPALDEPSRRRIERELHQDRWE
ncbi:MAG: cytochrome c-type biogenesis protein CcmH [Nitrospira sp.]|nr:cytochrome c-type biogenesis protein CcmH [Nitrospira sp.]